MNIERLEVIRQHLQSILDVVEASKEYDSDFTDLLDHLYNWVTNAIRNNLWDEYKRLHQ